MNAQIELQHADWRDGMMVWSGANFDALITDPPYSERTDKGFRTGTDGRGPGFRADPIGYPPIDRAYCEDLIKFWLPRVRFWFVVFGDHVTNGWLLDAMDAAGLYTFPPVPWTKVDGAPRYCGDGPSSQTEFLAIGRQRVNVPNKRFRRGYYHTRIVTGTDADSIVTGQKPVDLMRAIIRDYSEPGDSLVDPHAGSGSTLVAARAEGRSCLGFERDPDTFAKASARIGRAYTPDMFVGTEVG